MTASPEIFILDVGHGNCAVIRDGEAVVVLDAPPGPTLLEFLVEHEITKIDTVLISHADSDHFGGLSQLLSQRDIRVEKIFVNPDPTKDSASWISFRIAARDAESRGEVKIEPSLTTAANGSINTTNVNLEILAPSAANMGLGGAGGKTVGGRPISSNALSAVIRLRVDDKDEILITGDLDETGLEDLLAQEPEPTARILVFPHHGGRPGSSHDIEFAKGLCQAVEPEMVIFSIGRNKHDNPRPGIIQGVRIGAPKAHIACTQLSKHCASTIPGTPAQHLSGLAARGKKTNSCCAGSIRFSLGIGDRKQEPSLEDHAKFINANAPSALCRVPFES